MKLQKILNLLNEANNSKFVTRKWNIVNDNSKSNYAAANEITYNTETSKSNPCDYNNAYILVKCITKMDGTRIDDAENSDLVMPMYNVIEYSSNYSKTTESL